MNSFKYHSESEEQTRRLGLCIGQVIGEGVVIALNGTLGSGKTWLTKSIAEGLGIDPDLVNSPTFTLCVPHYGRFGMLHVDAYRINDLVEVDELGLDEWVEDGGVLIVEWAEKIVTAMPPIILTIDSSQTGESERVYEMSSGNKNGQVMIDLVRARLE